MKNKQLVSIIIRTCNRPDILKNALKSIEKQTYTNLEVIVVEDGKNLSKEMIKQKFPNLNIKYFSTQNKVGRTKAGNIGLSLASGDYFNFLDDDDILLPNHVETLVSNLLENNTYKAVYSIAMEYQIRVYSKTPYKFKVKRKFIRYQQEYHKLVLFHHNYIPIQSIMFHKELYQKYGGFDERLSVLEDWDLWIRYSLHTQFLFVPIKTSIYYTPYKSKEKIERDKLLHIYRRQLLEKFKNYELKIDVSELNKELNYIYNYQNQRNLLYWIKKIILFILYKDI